MANDNSTVEFDGIEFDAKDVKEACVVYENSSRDIAVVGNVVLFDDGDGDDAVYLGNRDTGERTDSYNYVSSMKDDVEDVIESARQPDGPFLYGYDSDRWQVVIPIDVDHQVCNIEGNGWQIGYHPEDDLSGVDRHDGSDGLIDTETYDGHMYVDELSVVDEVPDDS